jgi:hypothetical protein
MRGQFRVLNSGLQFLIEFVEESAEKVAWLETVGTQCPRTVGVGARNEMQLSCPKCGTREV